MPPLARRYTVRLRLEPGGWAATIDGLELPNSPAPPGRYVREFTDDELCFGRIERRAVRSQLIDAVRCGAYRVIAKAHGLESICRFPRVPAALDGELRRAGIRVRVRCTGLPRAREINAALAAQERERDAADEARDLTDAVVRACITELAPSDGEPMPRRINLEQIGRLLGVPDDKLDAHAREVERERRRSARPNARQRAR